MIELDTYALSKRYDPTQTTVLRNAFSRNMKRRFDELKKVIATAVVGEDCFGLNESKVSTLELVPPGNKAFSFLRDPEKINAFMRWLKLQEDRGILVTGTFNQLG